MKARLFIFTAIIICAFLAWFGAQLIKRSQPHKPISFEIFEVAEKRDVPGMCCIEYGHSYFLVNNYKDSPSNRLVLDSFMCTVYNPETIWMDTTIEEMQFSFFRKTKITNSEYLRKNPRDFFRHSILEDYICRYRFPMRGDSEIEYWNDGFPVEYLPGLKCN